jgi:hypothetical protein
LNERVAGANQIPLHNVSKTTRFKYVTAKMRLTSIVSSFCQIPLLKQMMVSCLLLSALDLELPELLGVPVLPGRHSVSHAF